jgi:hypothetical protein
MATDGGPTHHLVEKVNSSHFFTSLPEEKRTLLLLQKVQKAMHNVPDFVETCKAILDAVIEETDADNCSLMLRDLISGDLCICAAKGRKDENSAYYMIPPRHGKRFKPGEGWRAGFLRRARLWCSMMLLKNLALLKSLDPITVFGPHLFSCS